MEGSVALIASGIRVKECLFSAEQKKKEKKRKRKKEKKKKKRKEKKKTVPVE